MQAGQLRHFLPLVEKVVAQTKERVWGGNTHVADKVLSLFEPHTQVIRKGKAHKPNEFGRLLRVDEVENGIVSGYEVLEGNAADTNSWLPAIENHWDFNWGVFWVLVAYGALKFGVKRALGLYGARAKQKQPRHKPFHIEYHGK